MVTQKLFGRLQVVVDLVVPNGQELGSLGSEELGGDHPALTGIRDEWRPDLPPVTEAAFQEVRAGRCWRI
jgi:hypothetical protein